MKILNFLTKFRSVFLFLTVLICLSLFLFDLISGEGNDLRKSTSLNYIYYTPPLSKQILKSTSKQPKLHLLQFRNTSFQKPYTDQAIVLIHGNYKVDNMSHHLFGKLLQTIKEKRNIKMYSIQNQNKQMAFHDDLPTFENFISNIHQLIDYLSNSQGIKRFTIIAVQAGADALLNYLSRVSLDFYEILDKIVLVNAQYSRFKLFHNNYKTQYTKVLVRMSEHVRHQFINKLRIVSIQTKKLSRKLPQSQTKFILTSGQAPNRFLHIHSRHVWSIYTWFQSQSNFYFQPFINILSQFLALDSLQRLSIKQIDYLFRYKQDPQKQPVSIHKYEFALDCIDIQGNNFIDSRYFLQKGCYKFKFLSNHNSGFIMETKSSVEIFTQKYVKIPPFLSDNIKTIYYINNLSSLNGMYVRNPTSQTLIARFIKPTVLNPEEFNITISILRTNSEIIHFPDVPIRICPQTKLLFPIIDSTCIVLQNSIVLQNQNQITKTMKVYVTTAIDMYKELFRSYIPLHKNAIICYLFGLHIFRGNPYPLLGIQPIFMGLNLKDYSLQLLVLQTLFSLSIALCLYKTFGMLQVISKIFRLSSEKHLFMFCASSILIIPRYIPLGLQLPFNQWTGLIPSAFLMLKQPQIGLLNSLMIYLNADYLFIQDRSIFRFVPMQLILMVGYYQMLRNIPTKWTNQLNYVTLVLLNIFIQEDVSVMQTVLQIHIFILAGLCLYDSRKLF